MGHHISERNQNRMKWLLVKNVNDKNCVGPLRFENGGEGVYAKVIKMFNPVSCMF